MSSDQKTFRAASPCGASLTLAIVALTATSAGAADLKVTVTIKPLHALVTAVMTGVGSPELLVKGAASPHTYALKPSDARALHESDVFIRTSGELEPFTGKIVKSLAKDVKVVTLAETPGLELLAQRSGGNFEAHDRDHDHDHHDEHAEKGEEHDDEQSGRDTHIWLDPKNARTLVGEIARVLSEASPENAATFKANADRLTNEIVALEGDIARELAPVKGKPFVVFHDAYQYFERRFGLAAIGSITVSPEVQPSAKRLSEIRKKLSALEASCVFAEPQFQPNLVKAVTEGTRARTGTLDPEGALVEPGAGAYGTLMRNLAAALKTCLDPRS